MYSVEDEKEKPLRGAAQKSRNNDWTSITGQYRPHCYSNSFEFEMIEIA